jgi:hypothetical protein
VKAPVLNTYTNIQKRLGYLKLICCIADRYAVDKRTLVNRLSGILDANVQHRKLSYIDCLMRDAGLTDDTDETYNVNAPKEKWPEGKGKTKDNLAKEIIDLAQNMKILDKDCFLLEDAMPLSALIEESKDFVFNASPQYNPLLIDPHSGSKKEHTYLYMILLLHDLPMALLPSVLKTRTEPFHLYSDFRDADEYSEKNILLETFHIYETIISQRMLFSTIENYADWENYFIYTKKTRRSAFEVEKRMGRKTSYKHHATPRLEFLVDLAILDHCSEGITAVGKNWYRTNNITQKCAGYFEQHLFRDLDIDKFIRNNMFDFARSIYSLNSRNPENDTEAFKYFILGYDKVKRDIGNTPGWSASILGCLIAQDHGICIEINEMYRVAQEAGRKYANRIRYSGGSRFDNEFLIKVDPILYKELGIHERTK